MVRWCLPRGLGEVSGGSGLPAALAANLTGLVAKRRPGDGGDPLETSPDLLQMVAGEPEVSGAPVEVELDASEVAGAGEPLDPLGDLVGAGDLPAELVEGDGLAGGLTVAALSLESISNIFVPAMLWHSKVFLRSSTTLALMCTVPLMTPSVMVWTV